MNLTAKTYTENVALERSKKLLIHTLKNVLENRYQVKYFNNGMCAYCSKTSDKFNKSNLQYYIIQRNIKYMLNFCCNLHYYKFRIESSFIKCSLQLQQFNKKMCGTLYKQYIPNKYDWEESDIKITTIQKAYNYLYNIKTKSIHKKKHTTKKLDILDYIRNTYKA